MMIPALNALFLLSLFAFIRTHARTLPEDILKSSNGDNSWTSNSGNKPALTLQHHSSQVGPSHLRVGIISYGTGNPDDIITRARAPPPPPPHVAPPHIQTIGYNNWTSNIANTPSEVSHPSPQVTPEHGQGELESISCVTTGSINKEITKRPKPPSPPTPHVAPPHIQKRAYIGWTGHGQGELGRFSYVNTGSPDKKITNRPKKHSPPPPHVAPPHIQTSAYSDWTSIIANHETIPELSHPFQQVNHRQGQGELGCISHGTNRMPYDETIKRPKKSSPPPPRVAPPHIQKSDYCATESLCNGIVAAI